MSGHLSERRPGVWRVVVSAGFDEAGKRRQITRTATGSKRDAQRGDHSDAPAERDQGTLAGGRQTLADYIEREWLPAVSAVSKRGRPLAPTTRQRYADSMRHVSREIGNVRLSNYPAFTHRTPARAAPPTVASRLRPSPTFCASWHRRSRGPRPAASSGGTRPTRSS